MKQKITDAANKTLKELMAKEKVNTAMLSYFTGVPYTTLCRWTMEDKLPSILVMCKVAKTLRVTLDDFIPSELYGGLT